MSKVFVRDFETRSIVKEIDVSHITGENNYDRFVMGLLRNMDLDKYFLDEDEVLSNLEEKVNGSHSHIN